MNTRCTLSSEDRCSIHRRPRPRGFAMMHMLGVIVLASAFLLISGYVFRATLRITRDVQRGQTLHQTQQRVIDKLRADVWSAYEVRVGDPRTLLVRLQGDRSVTWQVLETPESADQPGEYFVRRAAFRDRKKLEEQEWALRRDRYVFALDGGVLVVTREGTSIGPEHELRLYSQLAVFAGAVGGGTP